MYSEHTTKHTAECASIQVRH